MTERGREGPVDARRDAARRGVANARARADERDDDADEVLQVREG